MLKTKSGPLMPEIQAIILPEIQAITAWNTSYDCLKTSYYCQKYKLWLSENKLLLPEIQAMTAWKLGPTRNVFSCEQGMQCQNLTWEAPMCLG